MVFIVSLLTLGKLSSIVCLIGYSDVLEQRMGLVLQVLPLLQLMITIMNLTPEMLDQPTI